MDLPHPASRPSRVALTLLILDLLTSPNMESLPKNPVIQCASVTLILDSRKLRFQDHHLLCLNTPILTQLQTH